MGVGVRQLKGKGSEEAKRADMPEGRGGQKPNAPLVAASVMSEW